MRDQRATFKAQTDETSKKDVTLKWTQNKLQAEGAKVVDLTEQLAKANQKIKEVSSSPFPFVSSLYVEVARAFFAIALACGVRPLFGPSLTSHACTISLRLSVDI